MLGKRKRDVTVVRRKELQAAQQEEVAQNGDAFRQYFESRFQPLLDNNMPTPLLLEDGSEAATEEEIDVSDWDGLSDGEAAEPQVQVIEHLVAPPSSDPDNLRLSKYKAFMSSKAPREDQRTANSKAPRASEDDDSETLNMKHDLDLQRLLKESHLLDQEKSSSAPGIQRHKATDMRIQALGSKTSLFVQDKMPLAHRKGIAAKETAREVTRRKDAQENGVILEKASKAGPASSAKRIRAVDMPAVGRFRGGTLKLNRKDISDIQGPASGRPRSKRSKT